MDDIYLSVLDEDGNLLDVERHETIKIDNAEQLAEILAIATADAEARIEEAAQ